MSKCADKTEKGRPGVMLYFENICPAVNRMSDEQVGMLLRVLLDYARYGELSGLDKLDNVQAVAFDLMRPLIDRDARRYEETREQRQYAAYARKFRQTDEQPLSIEEWRQNRQRESTGDNGPLREHNGAARENNENAASSPITTSTLIPTPATVPIPATAPSSFPSPSANTFSSGVGAGERSKGEGNKCAENTPLYRRDNAGRTGQRTADTHTFSSLPRDTGIERQAPKNESPAGQRTAGQGFGETDSWAAEEVQRLYAAWRDAWNEGERYRAGTINNQLLSLGYEVDIDSRRLRRRRE